MRSMIKSCLVLWADQQGNNELDQPQYGAASRPGALARAPRPPHTHEAMRRGAGSTRP
jgi:hypothetical protein